MNKLSGSLRGRRGGSRFSVGEAQVVNLFWMDLNHYNSY